MTFLDSAHDPKKAQARALKLFVIATLAVGASRQPVHRAHIPTWYAQLVRPAIAPPNWVFAPVWTTLYVVMAYAAWRVWRSHRPAARWRWLALGIQLALNFAWSAIFFALHRIGAALVEIMPAGPGHPLHPAAVLAARPDRGPADAALSGLDPVRHGTDHAFWQLNG